VRLARCRGPGRTAVKQVKDAALSGARTEVVCVNYRRDGSKFVNRLQVSPLYDYCGKVSHLLGVLTPAPEARWRIEAQQRMMTDGGSEGAGAGAGQQQLSGSNANQ